MTQFKYLQSRDTFAIKILLQVQHTVVLHETNLSMFALLSVDREEGNLAIVHRESVPGGGYRSVMLSEYIQLEGSKYKEKITMLFWDSIS